MDSAEQEIRALHATWIAAVNASDLARLLGMVTDDVVFLGPGRAPLDRKEFAAAVTASQQRVRVNCTSELEEVVVAGDVAYTRARDALTVTPRAGGETTSMAGHRLTIYRRQPDGRWLLARDVHTVVPVKK